MPRVIHFEINADRPEQAVKFYESVFGWDITKWEGPVDYWLIVTGSPEEAGVDGAIMRRQQPGAGVWNTVDVPSVDQYLSRVIEAGGQMVQAKTVVPGVGYLAYCQDPEGNVFGILEADETAQ
ncbi:MAG TPA: VOC family protein [Anaerolineae bacterium]|nr:VOC family protein [Anaerolineae bacterium]